MKKSYKVFPSEQDRINWARDLHNKPTNLPSRNRRWRYTCPTIDTYVLVETFPLGTKAAGKKNIKNEREKENEKWEKRGKSLKWYTSTVCLLSIPKWKPKPFSLKGNVLVDPLVKFSTVWLQSHVKKEPKVSMCSVQWPFWGGNQWQIQISL